MNSNMNNSNFTNNATFTSCRSCNNNVASTGYGFQLFNSTASPQQPFNCLPGASCGITGINSYVIIGDTVAATLYAARLVCNGVTNIIILTEGSNSLADNLLSLPMDDAQYLKTFDVTSNNIESSYLMEHPVYWVENPQGFAGYTRENGPADVAPSIWRHIWDTQRVKEGSINNVVEGGTQTYYTGYGTLGDFVAAYIVPRIGPWWVRNNTNVNLQNRFYTSTQIYNLNETEIEIYKSLRNAFCLKSTCLNLIVDTKSIMLNMPNTPCGNNNSVNNGINQCRYPASQGYQMTFVIPPTDEELWCPIPNRAISQSLTRQVYQTVETNINPNFYRTKVRNITITRGGIDGTYTVNYTSEGVVQPTINNTNVVWMTNHFDYLRLVSNSNEPPASQSSGTDILFPPFGVDSNAFSIAVPTSFRSTVSIPKLNCLRDPILDLSRCGVAGKVGDGVTSYVNFSLGERRFGQRDNNQSITWFVQAYTTDNDTYPVLNQSALGTADSTNKPNRPDQTLLIIEAVYTPSTNTAAQRRAFYVKNGNNSGEGVNIQFGTPLAEAQAAQDFLVIAANVLVAYTGDLYQFPDTNAVGQFFYEGVITNSQGSPDNTAVPSAAGSVTMTKISRELTVATVLQTGSWLYGNGSWIKMCPWNLSGSCPTSGCQNIAI